MKVRATQNFRDKVTKADRTKGDEFYVSADRYNELLRAGCVEAVEGPSVDEVAEAVAAKVLEGIAPLLTPSEE